MKKFLLLFLLCIFYVEGGFKDHLKPVLNKKPEHFHPIDGVDFAYIINLDERPEKMAHCIKELKKYNIAACRFSAVNGWDLSLDDLNDLGVKYEDWMAKNLWGTCYLPEDNFQPRHEVMHVVGRNYFCHCMTRGAIGIVLSHLSLLQDAYDSGYQTVWIMEDDIEVIQDPRLLSKLIRQLDRIVGKHKWDILYTDPDTKNKNGEYVKCLSYAPRPNFIPCHPNRFSLRTDVGNHFRKIGARYGAYSMIVRRTGMKKLLDFFKKYQIFLPYDMEFTLPNDMSMYTVTCDIVSTQPKALSDNGSPNYKINKQESFHGL